MDSLFPNTWSKKPQKLAFYSAIGTVVCTTLYGLFRFMTNTPKNTPDMLDIELFTNENKNKNTTSGEGIIWTRDYLIHYSGTTFYSTCTIIKLSTIKNGICIHSPCKLDNTIKNWIKLNNFEIEYIVAPGNYHYFNAIEWSNYYKNSKLLICPGIEYKLPLIKIDGFLFDKYEDNIFEIDFDMILIRGFNEIWEVVLYHKISNTLIFVDLIENIGDNTKGVNRMLKFFWKYIFFMWNNGYPAPEYQWSVKDKDAVRKCLNKIINNKEWNYNKIILSHGDFFIPNGKNNQEKHEKCQQFMRKAWKQFL